MGSDVPGYQHLPVTEVLLKTNDYAAIPGAHSRSQAQLCGFPLVDADESRNAVMFVKVHVTVCPAVTEMFVTGLPLLQVAVERSQPLTAPCATE